MNKEAIELLKKIEWQIRLAHCHSVDSSGGRSQCHICWNEKYQGHREDCKLSQALAKLRTAPEQPLARELLPWQQSLLNDYDQRRFLELIERYNHKLSGVWDKDFTINGERLLEIISYGWGATFSLDRSEASRNELLTALECFPKKLDFQTYEQFYNHCMSWIRTHQDVAIKSNKEN